MILFLLGVYVGGWVFMLAILAEDYVPGQDRVHILFLFCLLWPLVFAVALLVKMQQCGTRVVR